VGVHLFVKELAALGRLHVWSRRRVENRIQSGAGQNLSVLLQNPYGSSAARPIVSEPIPLLIGLANLLRQCFCGVGWLFAFNANRCVKRDKTRVTLAIPD